MQTVSKHIDAGCEWVADALGSNGCLFLFVLIAIVPVIISHPRTVLEWQVWLSQTFLQLVLLSVLQKGTKGEGSRNYRLLKETHDTVMSELQTIKDTTLCKGCSTITKEVQK